MLLINSFILACAFLSIKTSYILNYDNSPFTTLHFSVNNYDFVSVTINIFIYY